MNDNEIKDFNKIMKKGYNNYSNGEYSVAYNYFVQAQNLAQENNL